MMQQSGSPWYVDFANYLVSGLLPPELKFQQKKKFLHDVRGYQWDDPYLYKLCSNKVIRRCASEEEIPHILESFHATAYGGHFGGHRTTAKVCNDIITGLLFLKILMRLINVVTGVKEQKT